MIENIKDELIRLYQKNTKHSNYQRLPKRIALEIEDKVFVNTRFEEERLEYICRNVEICDKSILDIGGNSGYFTFELIEKGGKLDYWEGNKEHAEFVKLLSRYFNISTDKLKITNNYYPFDCLNRDKYDVILLLNVLHHVGDDFDDKNITIENAKSKIIQNLNRLSINTSYLVFQLGYNWKGNRNCCLFQYGTKQELIQFILEGITNNWDVLKIGIPEKIDNRIVYCDLGEKNILRDDSLGEFLNRPLFILKSKNI